MTSFWLFLSKVFKWSFGFYDTFGNVLNWILFIVACGYFVYWCWILVAPLGNNKDNEYHSDTEDDNPYYREDLYKQG
ncbi:hypothetical protein OZ664_08275 [Elizabethkingia sp. HX WHF]|jgi:hypothetical protein|uniref:Polysaccharide deacetylase n=2 Tax=Elizabethkingia TaxID=308865 RepID=A0AAQ1PG14_ELIMR|nr:MULTISPECIES: hypothetical protein [Elizabethkingia]AJW63614.1 hypothetical protein VO54_02142 [Elizabethkingia miricola]AQX86238.1 hypothetical protein AYC65_15030 [Elizabethkingia bruuniana]ATL44912.1 hypothetical protein CQS02_17155 [Elizabethkingia miricola]KGO10332.1 polysaccharide deacetylase [Elizabethkingia miricola]KUG10230.1 polysaccharide deacetylase [Elizabethkingia miricola]